MGTVLKIFGVLFIGFWLFVAVGCTMLVQTVARAGHRTPSSSYSSSRDPADDFTRATRGERNDSDRIIREVLAERERAEQRGGYSSEDRPYVPPPHFKPGEPMVNPNPGSSYDN